MDKVLIDSCIVIDFIKRNLKIEKELSKISKPCINFIIEMELLQGARNKNELQKIKSKPEFFWLLPMQNKIANLSSKLINQFSLSHNIGIPDGIIASTSLVYNLPLFTFNTKDFFFIPKIKLYNKPSLI